MGVSLGLRIRILARDGYRCIYCGAQPARTRLQVDHVVPRSKGGSDAPTNLVTACTDCNQGKSATALPLPTGYVVSPLPERARFQAPKGRVFDARFDDFRPFAYACDTCRAPADTVHWPTWPAVGAVRFACARHDPGGYWQEIPALFSGPQDWSHPEEAGRRYTGIDHIRDTKAPWLLQQLLRRLTEQAA
jgi:hypothetical protein